MDLLSLFLLQLRPFPLELPLFLVVLLLSELPLSEPLLSALLIIFLLSSLTTLY